MEKEGFQRRHYGNAPIERLDDVDIFRRDKLSYARFLKKLPKMVEDSFPIESTVDGHTYRLEIGQVEVCANLKGSPSTGPWIDEKAYASTKGECIESGDTLSYYLDGDVRIFKDNVLKGVCHRHLFKFPAMTSTCSLILNGEEQFLKLERSLNGETYRACGEVLEDIFSTCDFSGPLEGKLKLIADGRIIGVDDFEFRTAAKKVLQFAESPMLIPVSGINPFAEIGSKTSITAIGADEGLGNFPPEERAGFGENGLDLRDDGYNMVDILFHSITEKKEGAKLVENANATTYLEVNEDRKAVVPMHPVEDGMVKDEIVYVGTEDLLERGKKIGSHCPPGTKVPMDASVMSFALKKEPVFGKEKELYGDERGVVESDAGTVSEKGMPDYVPISRRSYMSVNESVNMFALCCNGTRDAMGIGHAKQAMALDMKAVPRITNGTDDAVVKSTEAALFAKESGTVVEADPHKVVVEGDYGTVEYELDETIVRNSPTDMRYTANVKVGDKVVEGQCIADGPFTRNGMLCLGATDLVGALIPFTAIDSVGSKGLEDADGAKGGTNNNDALILGESAAKKFRHHEILKFSVPIQRKGWGTTTFSVPSRRGVPDERFNPKTGLPKIGSRFGKNDIVLLAKVPNSYGRFSVVEALASENNVFGRRDDKQRLKSFVEGTVVDVRVTDEKVNVYLSYTREIEPGDKITIGYGQKATVTAIVPDESMPKLEMGGRTISMDIIPDSISFVKRGAPIGIEGLLRFALMEVDGYAEIGIGETKLVEIAANAALDAGLPVDGMGQLYIPQKGDGNFLPRNHCPGKARICAFDACLNKEGVEQRIKNLSKGVSLDRMGSTLLHQIGTDDSVYDGVSNAQDGGYAGKADYLTREASSKFKASGFRRLKTPKGLER